MLCICKFIRLMYLSLCILIFLEPNKNEFIIQANRISLRNKRRCNESRFEWCLNIYVELIANVLMNRHSIRFSLIVVKENPLVLCKLNKTFYLNSWYFSCRCYAWSYFHWKQFFSQNI